MIKYQERGNMIGFIDWFSNTIGQYISKEISIFIVSMIPLIEERGGFILASLLDVPIWNAIIWCVLGNIFPIPFILLFIKKLIRWLSGSLTPIFSQKCMWRSKYAFFVVK